MVIKEAQKEEISDASVYGSQEDILTKCLASGFNISAIKDGLYSRAQMEQIYYGFLDGVDITGLINHQFHPLQLKEIRDGLHQGLGEDAVSLYAKTEKNGTPAFTSQQMKWIKKALLSKLPAEGFLDKTLSAAEMEKNYQTLFLKQKETYLRESGLYNEHQLEVLTDAISRGYDIKQIENPAYQAKQMQEYLLAKYENQLRDDQLMVVSDLSFQAGQMREIRLGYAAGIDAGTYAHPDFSEAQMRVLRKGKSSGIDIRAFVSHNHTAMQMQVLTDALKCGIQTDMLERINDTRYSSSQMAVLAEASLSGCDITRFAKESLSPEKMRFLHQAKQKGLKASELRQIANADLNYYTMQKKLNQILRSRENMDLLMNLRFGMLFRNLWRQFMAHMKLRYRMEELYMHYNLPEETDNALRAYHFNAAQVTILEEAVQRGIAVDDFGKPGMSAEKMRLLMEAKAKDIPVSSLADPDFLTEQIVFGIRELKAAQKHGYDITPVLKKTYHVSQMQELISAIKTGMDVSFLLAGDYPADYIYQKKMEQQEEELASNGSFHNQGNHLYNTKESKEMGNDRKTLFGPATERKLPIEEQIKHAEHKRDLQILNRTREKTKDVEKAVI